MNERPLAAVCKTILAGLLFLLASTVFAQWGGVDSTFTPGGGNNAGFDADVFGVALQPDGRMIVGGFFTQHTRVSRNGVARLNADGTLDSSFNPGSGANNTIEVVTLQPDGKVLVGGRFTAFNGAALSYIARLNPNGSLDTTFNPAPDLFVLAMALQPDGKVIVGGAFTSISGTPRNYVARLNADGSLDYTFDPVAGPDWYVFALTLQSDGKVVIGGVFSSVNGTPRQGLARLNDDGSVDPTFDPGAGADNAINSLAMQVDGKILVGGYFTNIVSTTRYYVARLQPDGSMDSGFTPGINPVFGGVLTVQLEVDGKIFVGGDFNSVEGVSRNGLARLNADGSLDTTFNPGTGAALLSGTARVRGIIVQPDGRVVVGGAFTTFNGVKLNYIARLLGDQGGSVEFTNANFTVDEAGGTASLGVRRTGGLAGAVSVNYVTSDSTATAGADYVARSGVVVFGPGENNKTINVPLVADSLVEGNETFRVVLGNAIGGVVFATNRTATVTILDNTNSLPPIFRSISRVGNDQIRLSLTGQTGRTYVLQSATVLPGWSSIQTNVATNSVFEFLDSGAATTKQKFYRVFGQ